MNDSNKAKTWLFNPFTYAAGGKALLIGLAAILIAGHLGSYINIYFDGVLDTDSGRGAPQWFFLATGIIDWLCMAIVLWVIEKISAKQSFRAIDLFGTQALARWPMVLTALATLLPAYTRFTDTLIQYAQTQKFTENFNPMDGVMFGAAVLVMLLALCWMVRLMYQGFKMSCDLPKKKAIPLFITGLIIAEIVSKIAFLALLKQI